MAIYSKYGKGEHNPWKDLHLILIPAPPPEHHQELMDYLNSHQELVQCIDQEKPSTYWYGDEMISSYTCYFTNHEEAMAFYLKWNGYGTKIR